MQPLVLRLPWWLILVRNWVRFYAYYGCSRFFCYSMATLTFEDHFTLSFWFIFFHVVRGLLTVAFVKWPD
jgi:hypothetical protein